MFNQVTYNVLIERFKAFASGHYKIERFSHGQIDVTDIDKEQKFPWMHVVPVSMQPSNGSRSFTLDIVFADMPRDIENKTEYQRESLSDCMQLAEDLLAEIKNGGVIFGEDVTLEEGSAVQPFMEEYTHVLTGVTLSLTMTFPWNWNACDIPADWTTGGSSSGGGGGYVPALVLKVNNVDNINQSILNLVNGTNVTVEDLGDGRVRINSTGGIASVSWGEIVGNIADQLDLAIWFNEKADVTSLAEVAFTGDYNDLENLPPLNSGTVTSVGLSLPQPANNAFTVSNSPVTTSGTLNVTANGTQLQYIDGTAALQAFPTIPKTLADLIGNGIKPQDLIQWDGTQWVVVSLLQLSELANVDAPAPSNGQLIQYNSTTQKWEAVTVSFTQVNSDWNATSGVAEILNKPTLPPVIGDMLKSVYDTDNDGIVDAAECIQVIVRNSTGVTLNKGQVVYLSGATGNRPNALLADASTEATSSKTIGFVIQDIPNNSDGSIAVNGTLHDLDTSAFAAGDTLWLSETAGAWQANTPPAEPAHAVFLGYVARSHPNLGRVVIQIQNGYELNELHGVQISSEANNETILFESSTGLWKNKPIASSVISDATDVGKNLLTLPNPSAIRYLRVNADNSISALTLAQLKTDLSVGTNISVVLASNINNVGTNFEDITGLSFAVTAGKTYRWRATISFAMPTGTYAFSTNGPTATLITNRFTIATGGGTTTPSNQGLYNTGTNVTGSSSGLAIGEGIFAVSASGTFVMRFRASVAGNLTIRAGSVIEYQEVL
jgi:hypothetical protein